MPKIKFKRGAKANLPQLDEGEPGYTTDTKEFFIGSPSGNVQLAKNDDVKGIPDQIATLQTQVNGKASATDLAAKADKTSMGDLTTLQTTDKSSLVNAVNENTTQLADIAFNVKSYGAKGDGVHDDSTSINNAVTDCANSGGGIVYFPPGVYMGWVDLYQKHNVTLKGAGLDVSVIRLNATNKNVVATLQNALSWPDGPTFNVAVEDMTLDGNYNNLTANTERSGGYTDDNYQFGFYMMKTRGCRIERVRVTNVWVTNDLFWNNWDESDGKYYQTIVRDCIFDHCGDKQITITSGMTVTNAHLEIDNDSRNITIENCIFIGNDPTMTTVNKNLVNMNCGDSATIQQKNVRFINNKFYNQGVGIYGYGNLIDWIIRDNEFYNVGQCVYLYQQQGHPKEVEITGNTVINTSVATFTGNAVFRVQGQRPKFTNNKVRAKDCVYGFGVLAYAGDEGGVTQPVDATISENNIFCKSFTSDSGGAIALAGDGLIQGNVVECVDNTQLGKGIFCYENSVTPNRKYRTYNNQIRNFLINQSLYPVGLNTTMEKDNNLLTADAKNSGIAVLVNGAATINNSGIQASDIVLLSRFGDSTVYKPLRVVGYTAGVSFTVLSDDSTDNGQFWWKIIH